jgi:hypothetical protein
LDDIGTDMMKIFIIDGLNEVTTRIGQDIVFLMDEYVRYNANTNVLITDRLTRRDFDTLGRWQLALVRPLEMAEVQRQLVIAQKAKDKKSRSRIELAIVAPCDDLLSSPYFLDGYLKNPSIFQTRSAEFETFFLNHSLNEAELSATSEAAFGAYEMLSRTFVRSKFEAVAGVGAMKKLIAAGIVLEEGARAYFDHHLKHDFLAARFLAKHENLWTAISFKFLTFNASSFDAIALAIEQIQEPQKADRFFRKVFDWNLYGAGYALSEARNIAVPAETRVAALAMFAERRWDRMMATSERASDTLSLIPGKDAEAFRLATCLAAVFAVLENVSSKEGWFPEWKRRYMRSPGEAATDEDFDFLKDTDSVVGWTAANVLKRLALTEPQLGRVRDMLKDGSDVVRWRAAHVLGAFASEPNLEALFSCLERDASISVKYGALRSLIELASRQKALAEQVFNRLLSTVEIVGSQRSLTEEFQRAIFIDPKKVPPRWRHYVLPVASALRAMESRTEGVEQWDRVLTRFQVEHGLSDLEENGSRVEEPN